MRSRLRGSVSAALLSLSGLIGLCGADGAGAATAAAEAEKKPAGTATAPAAFASTYKPLPSSPVLVTNATLLLGNGERVERGSILLQNGRIAAVGSEIQPPAGAVVVDAAGKWVTPGIIDAHSHIGVDSSPSVDARSDLNEATDPVTAEVWAEHSVWPQDLQFGLALAGGITTQQILPGSANLFGGRSVTVKSVPGRSVYDMKFPGAPQGLKMACGENPKRVYGERNRAPSTRMGSAAGYREAWNKAREYQRDWDEYRRKKKDGKEASPPDVDLQLETLAGALDGSILVQTHCYEAGDMLVMINIAREFGYKIAAFHHAVEAYKIADILAREGICVDMWADSWGFKLEAFDGIPENAALVHKAGGCAVIHSDSGESIQRLNQEAAKAMTAGNRMGMSLKPEDAIRWITLNPAKSLGIADQTGSLEKGKMADVVLWNGNPLSVYAKAEKVWVDGALVYDRKDPSHQPVTDFELGIRDGSEVER